MGLTIAGVEPILAEDWLIEWVRCRLNPADAFRFRSRPAFPGMTPTGVQIQSSQWQPPQVVLGSFVWPWGASRFASAAYLFDRDSMEELRNTAFGEDGLSTDTVLLSMDAPNMASDTVETVETDLYMLPPVPLARVPGGDSAYQNGLYLGLFVDVRYYWRYTPCPKFNPAINDYDVHWSDLIDQIGEALDVDIDVDDIDPAYRLPHHSLQQTGQNIAIVLDLIANSIGMRCVRNLDGGVRLIGPQTALAIRQADDAAHSQREIDSGGYWFSDFI